MTDSCSLNPEASETSNIKRFKPPNGTLNGVEFFRGVAATLVVVYHVSRHFDKNFGVYPLHGICKFGHAGVDFFFVLSGFIILFIHEKDIGEPARLYSYIAKRAARIYPFYWVILTLSILLIPFTASVSFPDLASLSKQMVLWPQGMEQLIVGVSWTLQYEILFYIAFAALIIDRSVGCIVLAIWFALIVLRNFTPFSQQVPVVGFSDFSLEFFMGMVCARLLSTRDIPHGVWVLGLGVLGFAAMATLELTHVINGYHGAAHLGYGAASMLLVIGIVSRERAHGLAVPWLARLLGRSSYSIYLSQLLLNGVIFKIFLIVGLIGLLPYAGSEILIICLIVIGAAGLSRYVELPLTRRIRRTALKP